MADDKLTEREQKIVNAAKVAYETYGTQLSLRQIFYRLVASRAIDKTESQYKGLSALLVKARKLRLIDSSMMEDRTRKYLAGDDPFETAEQHYRGWRRAFLDCANLYKYPRWKDQPEVVQVWCEKQALERLFSSVCVRLKVRLGVCKGYPSFTFLQEANRTIRAEGKPVTILYFGDWDPSGLDIDRHIAEEFGDFFRSNVTVERISITEEQIEEYELISAPAKKSDARANGFIAEHGDEVYELAAFEPDDMTAIIEEAVMEHVDKSIWDDHSRRQNEIRKKVLEMVKGSGLTVEEDEIAEIEDDDEDESEGEEEDEE